jgi:hypothetical protein
MVNINAGPRVITEFIAEEGSNGGYAYNKTSKTKET